MNEKPLLDPEHTLMLYERDHIAAFRAKGVDSFRYTSDNLSVEGIINWFAQKEKMPADQIRDLYKKGSETECANFLKTYRRDMILSMLTDFFTRWYARGKDKQVPERDRQIMAKRLIEYFKDTESEYFSDYSDLSEVKIENSILEIHRWNDIRHIDLAHALVQDHDPRRKELQNRTAKAAEELKEKISTEVYMAGVVSVEYEKLDTSKRQAIGDVMAIGVGAHSVVVPLYRVRKMLVRNKEGKMETVKPTEPIEGRKVDIETQIFGSLRASGYVFDVAMQAFISVTRQAIESSIHTVALSTFEQYRQISGVANTRENRLQFAEVREQMLADARKMLDPNVTPELQRDLLESASKKIGNVWKIAGSALGMSMEAVFWGVFFSAYHKNAQDLAGVGIWVAEIGLFRLGNLAGKFIPAPPVLKPFMPMLGGMALTVLGTVGASSLGLDKAFWQEFPDREDFWEKNGGKEGNSLIGHILTAGPVNAYYDKNQTDWRIGRREGLDVHVPFWDGRMKTVGSLDIGRSTVDINTPPWEYMGEWIGRDVDTWNIQVEKYREWLTIQVTNLMRQYDEWKNVFEVWNVLAHAKGGDYDVAKKRILTERIWRLFPHFDPEWNGHNTQYIKNIVRQATEYVTTQPVSRREQLMGFFIGQQIDLSMPLNGRNLKAQKIRTEQESWLNSAIVSILSEDFADQRVGHYIREIFGGTENGRNIPSRIFTKKRLVDVSLYDNVPAKYGKYKVIESNQNGSWIENEFLGTKSKVWVPWARNWEREAFTVLIWSKRVVSDKRVGMLLGLWESATVGDVFYHLLNRVTETKRMKEFTQNIAQTGRAQKWRSGLD